MSDTIIGNKRKRDNDSSSNESSAKKQKLVEKGTQFRNRRQLITALEAEKLSESRSESISRIYIGYLPTEGQIDYAYLIIRSKINIAIENNKSYISLNYSDRDVGLSISVANNLLKNGFCVEFRSYNGDNFIFDFVLKVSW